MRIKQLAKGDQAPDNLVYAADGQPVQIADLWANGPVLLTFLRHFGWIFCREWLAQLEQSHEEIEATGLRIVAVGLGEPKHAQRFCGKLAPSLVCHVDQDETAYKTYGLQQGGILALAGPAMLMAAARAAASGHVQGQTTGDTRMLPGTFIIDGEGIVQFAHYSRHPGDHPKIKKLVGVMAEQFDEEE